MFLSQLGRRKMSTSGFSSAFAPSLGTFKLPHVQNEPMKSYGPGSPERAALAAALKEARKAAPFKVPIVVNGEKVFLSFLRAFLIPIPLLE